MRFSIGAKIASLSILLVVATTVLVGWVWSQENNTMLVQQELGRLKDEVTGDEAGLQALIETQETDVDFIAAKRSLVQRLLQPEMLGLSQDRPVLVLENSFIENLEVRPQYLGMAVIAKERRLMSPTSASRAAAFAVGATACPFTGLDAVIGIGLGLGPQGTEPTHPFARLSNLVAEPSPRQWGHLVGVYRNLSATGNAPEQRFKRISHQAEWLPDFDSIAPARDLPRDQILLTGIEYRSLPANPGTPPLALIRLASPIYSRYWDERLLGVALIDVDFRGLVQVIRRFKSPDQKRYLTDLEGKLLAAPDPADLGKPIQQILPAVAPAFGADGKLTPTEFFTTIGGQRHACFFRQVSLRSNDRGPYVGLAVTMPYQSILASAAARKPSSWGLFLGVLVGASTLAFLFAQVITRPLKRIMEATHYFARGQFDVALPVKDHGEIGTLACAFRDMIGKVRQRTADLQGSEARIRAILDTAAEGILTLDEEGRILSFNQAAEQTFGYRAREVIGQKKGMLFFRIPVFSPDQSVEDSMAPGYCHELLGRRKDGTTFSLELSQNTVDLGDHALVTCIVRDITERKQAEDEIRLLNQQLDQRVRDRTAELNQANEELARARDQALAANQAKSAFLANMSHELRTPLTTILGYCDELLEIPFEEWEPQLVYRNLNIILHAGKHQLAIVNDILDLAKIEVDKLELSLETFDLAPVIKEVEETVEPLVKKNANTLRCRCPGDVGVMRADKTRVRQVLFNLLSNACKFTEKSEIVLDVSRQAEEGRDWLTFRVQDRGIGMTPEQLGKLFQPFTQFKSSRSSKHAGTGLGLTISRRVCRLMGGDIEVESATGVGSTFTVRLPAEVAPAAIKQRPVEKPAPPPPPAVHPVEPPTGLAVDRLNTVLVIDDDPAVCDLVRRFLGREGFQVLTASNGPEGLRLARQYRPAAITLDVMMPGMDGWAVLSALKAEAELAAIPVVMLTIVDEKNLGFALGADDYLTKPIEWGRLAEVLKEYRAEAIHHSILVVEDDAATRQLLRRALEKDGWLVAEAANGRDALAWLEQGRPALILLDLLMPEMDGFQFVAELRQHPGWQNIPVVVVTAKDLSAQDELLLNGSALLSGCVKRILHKGAYHRDDLLREIRDLVGTTAQAVAAAPATR